MKRILFILLTIFASQASHAQRSQQTPNELHVASCKAWVFQVTRTIDLMSVTGAISGQDAAAHTAVVNLLNGRCASLEARRTSDLLVLVLDLLTDPPNQP